MIITTHNLSLGEEAEQVITLEDGRILREEPGHGGSADSPVAFQKTG